MPEKVLQDDPRSNQEPAELLTGRQRDQSIDLFLMVQRLADRLMKDLEHALRPTGMTVVQFLVLRSLRQAGSAGLPSNLIIKHMTTHDPDITRLLDKLEERDVITRKRDRHDRRLYRVRLTRLGLRTLKGLTQLARDVHDEQFDRLPRRARERLSGLIDQFMGELAQADNEDDDGRPAGRKS